MTPAARIAAAIGVLDRWLSGTPAEQALTNWARGSRFAGAGDRQAVRDLVFDGIRCRLSFAHMGGAGTGRGLMIGLLRARGDDPDSLFTGEGHAPAPLLPAERGTAADMPDLVALDCPDWIAPALRDSLGDRFAPVMQALRSRAPMFLRVNTARITRTAAAARLADEGIATEPHALAETALRVISGGRGVQRCTVFAEGLVEVQDAASQAVVETLPVAAGDRVLDLCAGGGGKALALAARGARVTAHDANAGRMRDLPGRAARAGARIDLSDRPEAVAPFDLVLADVPCSGSGAWRRSPEEKWRLTAGALADLVALQAAILDRAAGLVRPGGSLAYATCSLLRAENDAQARGFAARHPGFRPQMSRHWTPLDGGDGFFVAIFERAT
ncbi:MAG: RsmB/NOP family class I SAM-dependent RNA methyltransferase [Paracoccaceae bacterium]|nr:MAG: RsmB/NOP family class I SAM-dependent RNA methyltransferase [Paracoccaceae bacterium]